MATATASAAELIQQRMSQIRHDLDETVDEISDQARRLRDWRYYMHRYPWLLAGAAAGLGYLVVPARSKVIHLDAEKLAGLSGQQKVVVQPRPGMMHFLARTVLTHLSNTLVRMTAEYLAQRRVTARPETSGPAQSFPGSSGNPS